MQVLVESFLTRGEPNLDQLEKLATDQDDTLAILDSLSNFKSLRTSLEETVDGSVDQDEVRRLRVTLKDYFLFQLVFQV